MTIETALRHFIPSCTGNWQVVDGGSKLRCDACGKLYDGAITANHIAAIEENYAGILLRRLTQEGQGLL